MGDIAGDELRGQFDQPRGGRSSFSHQKPRMPITGKRKRTVAEAGATSNSLFAVREMILRPHVLFRFLSACLIR
jgi:hypothetical protein